MEMEKLIGKRVCVCAHVHVCVCVCVCVCNSTIHKSLGTLAYVGRGLQPGAALVVVRLAVGTLPPCSTAPADPVTASGRSGPSI